MSSNRESDVYVHHQPNSASKRVIPKQFTWLEALWMIIVSLSYLIGYCVQISIIIEKFSLEEPPRNRGLYVLYFLLPHIAAGLKNVQYHYREANEEEGEDGPMGWLLVCLLFPFSPIHRFLRAWQFGLAEKDDWQNGIRFVDEMMTVGVLRLFDILLGDFPTLTLLVRDDVWSRSEDWANLEPGFPLMMGLIFQGQKPSSDPATCGGLCSPNPPSTLEFWTIFRMFFLLSKMAQGITFYLAITKRLQRLQHPSYFRHLKGSNARQGRLHFFATILLYFVHFSFIGSRVLCYSIVSQAWGAWVYLIAGLRWLIHSAWHLISLLNSHGSTPARSVSSLTMGGVWLIVLTNEAGGRQLGRFILYYGIALLETVVCGFLWNGAMKTSGDYFAFKASWATLIIFLMAVFLHITYYSLCHPGSPSITKEGLQCCSGDRRDPIDSDDDDDDDDDNRHNTPV